MKSRAIYPLIIVLIFLTACKTTTPAPTVDAGLIATEAILTYQADLTRNAPPTPTDTLQPSNTPTITETILPTLAISLEPPSGPDIAELIDQTPPDGAEIGVGQKFDIVWTIRNIGTTTWNKKYKYRYFSGTVFCELNEYYLRENVAPGQTVKLIVDAYGRPTPATYNMNWVLTNEDGVNFYPVNVTVKVVKGATKTPTDLPTDTPTPDH
jgi:hypothetical protein